MLKDLFKKTNRTRELRDFTIYCYISKNNDCYLCVYKENEYGFGTLSKLQSTYLSTSFEEISKVILNYISEIKKDPIIESNNKEGEETFKKMLNGKTYKRFCEENILINISYNLKANCFYLNNCPKDTKQVGYLYSSDLSAHYSTKYICHSQQEIQEAIEKAYEEGLAYLEAIGEPLKDPKDYKNTDKSNESNKSNNSNNNSTDKESDIHNNTDKDIINEVPLYKNTWLVLKNDDNDGFSRLLSDINNKSKTTYTNALKASREDKIMITGLYDDYYVISGFNIPSGDKTEEVKSLLDKLSNYSSEIAYYSSFRTVDLFGFAYMKDKKLLRLYSYCDSILANIGDKLPIEDKLNINLTDNDDNLFKEGYDLLDEDIITSISNGLLLPLEDLIGRQADETYTFDIEDLY